MREGFFVGVGLTGISEWGLQKKMKKKVIFGIVNECNQK